jgi:hypothetical protein
MTHWNQRNISTSMLISYHITSTSLQNATTNAEQDLSFSGSLYLVMAHLAESLDYRPPKGKDNTNANAADTHTTVRRVEFKHTTPRLQPDNC